MTSQLRVLFVEDDEQLREETTHILKALFKEVTVAGNGKEGLELFIEKHKAEKGYFDLVVTDIVMPKMSGIDMAKKIVLHSPQQNFIFISAHQDSDYLVNLIDIGSTSFISKPITFESLKSVLYKSCLQLEQSSLQKNLLYKVLDENKKLKKQLEAIEAGKKDNPGCC